MADTDKEPRLPAGRPAGRARCSAGRTWTNYQLPTTNYQLDSTTTPRPSDRERDPRRLNVHEQPLPVRAVARAGELAAPVVLIEAVPVNGAQIDVVLDEAEDHAVGGEAVHVLGAVTVFAQHESAARAHREVVGCVEDVGRRRLEQQPQPLISRIVFEDLSLSGIAATARHEVDDAVAIPRAFELAKAGRAFRSPLVVHARGPGRHGGVRSINDVPHHVAPLAVLIGACVGQGNTSDAKHLEDATV